MYTTNPFFLMAALAAVAVTQKDPASVCISSRQFLMTAGPTLPAALSPYSSYLIPPGTPNDPTATVIALPDPLGDSGFYVDLLCSVAAQLPSSILPEFASWGSGLLSFASVHISEFNAYITDCVTTGEAASTIISSLNNLLTGTTSLCPRTTIPGSTSIGTVSTTATPTATGANSTSTTAVITAAAARPTGIYIGAVAIGGLIGAAAML